MFDNRYAYFPIDRALFFVISRSPSHCKQRGKRCKQMVLLVERFLAPLRALAAKVY
jgi:hypothetical protein